MNKFLCGALYILLEEEPKKTKRESLQPIMKEEENT